MAVVRESDGLLRRAFDHERSRLIRTFYPQPFRNVEFPKIFSQPYIEVSILVSLTILRYALFQHFRFKPFYVVRQTFI